MTDPFKTAPFGDKQSKNIHADASMSRVKKEKKKGAAAKRFSSLYQGGVELFKSRNIFLELSEEGSHVLHKVWVPDSPKPVEGITYPHAFRPLREIQTLEDFFLLETVLETAPTDIKDFWQPLVHPKAGDSELLSFSERKLRMLAVQKSRDFYEVLDYKQSFDPDGSLCNKGFVSAPMKWVPAREWFDEKLHQVKFEDVFTIFPPAERELLKLLIGRIGVGRSGHLPPGFDDPIVHTARMAAVIVGQDPGYFSEMMAWV